MKISQRFLSYCPDTKSGQMDRQMDRQQKDGQTDGQDDYYRSPPTLSGRALIKP